MRADRQHTLCFECFRAERDRQRARRLAEIRRPAPLTMPAAASAGGALDDRRVAHRRAMLLHLERSRAAGSES